MLMWICVNSNDEECKIKRLMTITHAFLFAANSSYHYNSLLGRVTDGKSGWLNSLQLSFLEEGVLSTVNDNSVDADDEFD